MMTRCLVHFYIIILDYTFLIRSEPSALKAEASAMACGLSVGCLECGRAAGGV